MKKLSLVVAILFLATGISLAQETTGVNVGNKAPELTGKSVDGSTIKLSDTRGKLVLLDFWASWCPPCRKENPNVVRVYNKFKDKNFTNGKGFTVFSVSLDRNADAWKKGITDDKLAWPYHISDLKWWQSKHAAVYGIRQIPSSFLIDENGIIIARNLRGPSLEAALEKYVK